jgi:hypothetical protein
LHNGITATGDAVGAGALVGVTVGVGAGALVGVTDATSDAVAAGAGLTVGVTVDALHAASVTARATMNAFEPVRIISLTGPRFV